MAIYFNPGDDFAQRRVLAKKIEEKPEENINDNNDLVFSIILGEYLLLLFDHYGKHKSY